MSVLRPIRFVALAATLAAGILLGCFSDHTVDGAQPGTGSCRVPESPELEGSTLVTISGYAFHPAQVRVRPGGRVTWVNCETTEGLSHTSTGGGGAWSSPLIAPGTTFSQTFDSPGAFSYHCEPHPFMQGSVIVE
jgi:plastocyanin